MKPDPRPSRMLRCRFCTFNVSLRDDRHAWDTLMEHVGVVHPAEHERIYAELDKLGRAEAGA